MHDVESLLRLRHHELHLLLLHQLLSHASWSPPRRSRREGRRDGDAPLEAQPEEERQPSQPPERSLEEEPRLRLTLDFLFSILSISELGCFSQIKLRNERGRETERLDGYITRKKEE